MTRRIRSFIYGITLPYSAARLIWQRKELMLWSLLPVSVTLILYIYLISALQTAAHEGLTGYFTAWGWDPQGWAAWLLTLISKLLLLLVGALTFTFSSSIVASPFNDLLAEKTERHAEPALPVPVGGGFRQQLRIILIDLGKTLAATGASIGALLFSWVPVLNLVAFGIAFMLVTFQYISYPQTRRGAGVKDGFRFLWNHSWACVGFGAAVSFFYTIPFLSSLALPAAVVGGTLLVARAQDGSLK